MKPLPKVTCVYIINNEMMNQERFTINTDGSDHVCAYTDMSTDDAGGLWLAIAKKWLASNADYICYMPPFFDNVNGRFRAQIDFMKQNDLAASYGDVAFLNETGNEYSWEQYPEFSAEMIGAPVIPTETLLIDRNKFISVGGFDYMIAGSYNPIAYIMTMCAVAGRIMKLPNRTLVHAKHNASDPMTRERELSWLTTEGQNMWDRLKINKFVMQARKMYRDRRW